GLMAAGADLVLASSCKAALISSSAVMDAMSSTTAGSVTKGESSIGKDMLGIGSPAGRACSAACKSLSCTAASSSAAPAFCSSTNTMRGSGTVGGTSRRGTWNRRCISLTAACW
ncbi:hypothetical protein V8C86DRAFT_2569819, partial [Haematococcus lacustris]